VGIVCSGRCGALGIATTTSAVEARAGVPASSVAMVGSAEVCLSLEVVAITGTHMMVSADSVGPLRECDVRRLPM